MIKKLIKALTATLARAQSSPMRRRAPTELKESAAVSPTLGRWWLCGLTVCVAVALSHTLTVMVDENTWRCNVTAFGGALEASSHDLLTVPLDASDVDESGDSAYRQYECHYIWPS